MDDHQILVRVQVADELQRGDDRELVGRVVRIVGQHAQVVQLELGTDAEQRLCQRRFLRRFLPVGRQDAGHVGAVRIERAAADSPSGVCGTRRSGSSRSQSIDRPRSRLVRSSSRSFCSVAACDAGDRRAGHLRVRLRVGIQQVLDSQEVVGAHARGCSARRPCSAGSGFDDLVVARRGAGTPCASRRSRYRAPPTGCRWSSAANSRAAASALTVRRERQTLVLARRLRLMLHTTPAPLGRDRRKALVDAGEGVDLVVRRASASADHVGRHRASLAIELDASRRL